MPVNDFEVFFFDCYESENPNVFRLVGGHLFGHPKIEQKSSCFETLTMKLFDLS